MMEKKVTKIPEGGGGVGGAGLVRVGRLGSKANMHEILKDLFRNTEFDDNHVISSQ